MVFQYYPIIGCRLYFGNLQLGDFAKWSKGINRMESAFSYTWNVSWKQLWSAFQLYNSILESAGKDSSPLGLLLCGIHGKVQPVFPCPEQGLLTPCLTVTSLESFKMPPLFYCPKFSIILDRALSNLKYHCEINAVGNQFNCNVTPQKISWVCCRMRVQVAQSICASWHLSPNTCLFSCLRSVFSSAAHSDVNLN